MGKVLSKICSPCRSDTHDLTPPSSPGGMPSQRSSLDSETPLNSDSGLPERRSSIDTSRRQRTASISSNASVVADSHLEGLSVIDSFPLQPAGASPSQVPEIAHWFWTGGPISQDDLSNIIDFAKHNPHHKLNLWTNKVGPLHRALVERSDITGFSLLDRIEVRGYDEAFGGDWGGITSAQKAALQGIVERELNGTLSNPAAASDVVRLVALYRFGGAYFDADVRFTGPMPSGLSSPKGILLDIRPGSPDRVPNSIMAAGPKSELVGELLKTIVDIYAHSADECREEMRPAKRMFLDAADLARRGTAEHMFTSEFKSEVEIDLERQKEDQDLMFDFRSEMERDLRPQSTDIRPLTEEEKILKSREGLSMENPATWQLKREPHMRGGQNPLLDRRPRDFFTVMATGPTMIDAVLKQIIGPDYHKDETMRIKNDFFVQVPSIGTFARAKDKPLFMNEV